MLNLEYETFVVYVPLLSSIVSLSSSSLDIHPPNRPQIANLIAKEAFTKVPNKYLDFKDIFSPNLASKLSKYIKINNHTIKLIDGEQPLYEPIYSLEPIELETLKAYIETNLVNEFIRLSKSPIGDFILFDRKLDSFPRLCINYQNFNNFTIKNGTYCH